MQHISEKKKKPKKGKSKASGREAWERKKDEKAK
jgi:hypothetical protein